MISQVSNKIIQNNNANVNLKRNEDVTFGHVSSRSTKFLDSFVKSLSWFKSLNVLITLLIIPNLLWSCSVVVL